MKWRGSNKRLTGMAFGVVPKFQALGIDSFLIKECGQFVQGNGWYDMYEMGWAGEWNPKMINIYKSLGGKQSRRLVTYRHLFDPNQNFERHPEMSYK
jgi:GNAT superfamily N-acetyltransferase